MSAPSRYCSACCGYLGQEVGGEKEGGEGGEDIQYTCSICFGLWEIEDRLKDEIRLKSELYGGLGNNYVSFRAHPVIIVPGDVALRYKIASTNATSSRPKTLGVFLQALKDHLRSIAIDFMEEQQNKNDASKSDHYPPCVHDEHQGYLSFHLIVSVSDKVHRPDQQLFWVRKAKVNNRKRFRGTDPTLKQGGDPLDNQQKRINASSTRIIWTVSEVEAALSNVKSEETWESLRKWMFSIDSSPPPAQLHAIIWRLPFFVRALYTKTRRDISQTPFYVPARENGKNVMRRKGTTSVEEQITQHLSEVSGGISTSNNDADEDNIVYGMIKFHASGREDMNVRMLLPPHRKEGVGGRPFVCEVIDAKRLPPYVDLKNIVKKINQPDNEIDLTSDIRDRSYGQNSMGVGISDCFTFVPGDTFKNLQSETEEKVKFYGCYCWSERAISTEEELRTLVEQSPIGIQQRTPIRVLHRRSNSVRQRNVLTLRATRIDKHYFRLNLSTDAGTYVKEFVHGDLGRTIPSISSLMGCKTDILELDCEGIQGV